MLPIDSGRRTQVVKGEVCKTSMQRFESARRLHILIDLIGINTRLALLDTLIVNQLRFFCYLSPLRLRARVRGRLRRDRPRFFSSGGY
jgi:hypothetical protein